MKIIENIKNNIKSQNLEIQENNLTDNEINEIAQTILSNYITTSLIDSQIHQETEFYESNNKAQPTTTPFDILSENYSISAKNYLKYYILNKTICNIDELRKRQKFIQHFIDKSKISHIKKEFKENEKAFYWFINPKLTEELNEILNNLYFSSMPLGMVLNLDKINTDSKFMNYYYIFLMIISPLWGLVSPLFFFIIPFFATRYIFKIDMPISDFMATLKSTLLGDNLFNSISGILNLFIVKKIVGGSEENPGFFTKLKLFVIVLINRIINSKSVRYVYLFFMIAGYIWSIYTSYSISKNYYKIIKFIFTKLEALYKLVNISKILYSYLEQYLNILPDNIEEKHNNMKKILQNPILMSIFDNKEIFISPYNLLTNKGILLSLFYKLKSLDKSIFDSMINYVASIETYMKLADSVSNLNLTAADFLVKRKPQLFVYKLKNISIKNFVENNINLVKDKNSNSIKEGRQNLLLSGSNGSGKSTFLKSLMIAVILSQTIGFTSANKMRLTPFTYLSTYLNIPDCIGKESLFQAEMKRCHQHLNNLKEMEKEQRFSLNIMDEIFVSTNYYEGISGAWAVIKNVANYKSSINIITTHFGKCLDDELPDYVYKHFSISSSQDDKNKSIVYDYKLRDGVNKKHSALYLLEKYGFDKDLIEDARNKYKEIIEND